MLSDRTRKAIKDISNDKQHLDKLYEWVLLLDRGLVREEEFLIEYNKYKSLRGRIQNED